MNHASLPLNRVLLEAEAEPNQQDDLFDIERLFTVALRQAKVVGLSVLIALIAGVLFLATTPPTYTAEISVLIDERLNKIVDDTSVTATAMFTDSSLESQIQIIKSNRLALTVVEEQGLHENPSFLEPPTSALSDVIGFARSIKSIILPGSPVELSEGTDAAGLEQIPTDLTERHKAARILQKNLKAGRVGRSHVISISYSSPSPVLAKEIANAYANAYLEDQLNASFEATEQAAVWLEGRLTELRESSQKAALAVEKFRTENGLTASGGELLAEQQLSDLTSQLIEAKSDTARALARSKQYQSILAAGVEYAAQNASLPADMQTEASVLIALKAGYLNVTKREQDITGRYGADHPQATALREEQQQLAQQIFRELNVLAAGFQNEYEVALSRETALQESISIATGQNSEAREFEVGLRELEQRATALSALYNTFLTRYEESAQESSFPVSKVRIISEAGLPRAPSGPRSKLVLGLSIVLGLFVGGGVGAFNEFNERFFRTANDVRDRIGVKFLGYIPSKNAPGLNKLEPVEGWRKILRRLTPWRETHAVLPTKRLVTGLEKPGTMSAETLRSTKLATDVVLQGKSGVVAVVSALPDEGKSTTAVNLAAQLAAGGEKVLLIDGDLRNPGLTRSLNTQLDFGLIECLIEGRQWRTALMRNDARKFYFLPAVLSGQFTHSDQLLSSHSMRDFLNDAKTEFTYIVVDLPPLGPVVDAAAFAPLMDVLILVVEWGKTPRKLIRSILAAEPIFAQKLLGIIINKVNMAQLPKYGSFGSSEKHFHRYINYYTSEDL